MTRPMRCLFLAAFFAAANLVGSQANAATPEHNGNAAPGEPSLVHGDAFISLIPTLSSPSVKNGGKLEIGALVKAAAGVREIVAEIKDGDRVLATLKLAPKAQATNASPAIAGPPAPISGAAAQLWNVVWDAKGLEEKNYTVRLRVADGAGHGLDDESLSFTDPVAGISTVGSASYPSGGMGRVAAATPGSIGGYVAQSAVIEPAAGYAYIACESQNTFGTNPGVIVKIRLSDFTRVASLELNESENDLRTAVIDNNFVYFAKYTTTSPGLIVKISLVTFLRVGALTLQSGDTRISCGVLDLAGGYMYFGSDTVPGQVVKVRISDFSRFSALSCGSGDNYLQCAVIGGGYAYFGAFVQPGRVVKIRLSDFTYQTNLLLQSGEDNLKSAQIDVVGGFAYFVAYTVPARVVKVRLSDFVRVGAVTLNTGENQPESSVLNKTAGYLYIAAGSSPTQLVRVRLSDFTRFDAQPMGEDGAGVRAAGMVDSAGDFVYFANHDYQGKIIKFLAADTSIYDERRLSPGEDNISCGVVDAAGGFAYFATSTVPAKIIKTRLTDLASVATISLNNGENTATAMSLDLGGGCIYVCLLGSPGKVLKIRLSDLARLGTLTLNSGENAPGGAALDWGAGFLYCSLSNSPGKIVKIQTSDMTRIGALTLNAGENLPRGGAVDAGAGYVYFTLTASPGKIVKIRLSDFTRNAVLTLNAGENNPVSAELISALGFAYFGCGTTPGKIVKVKLSNFTRESALTLNADESTPWMIQLDPNNSVAYAGLDTDPGRVVKFAYGTMTRIGAIELNAGESYLEAGGIDSANHNLYFGCNAAPGAVVKIGLVQNLLGAAHATRIALPESGIPQSFNLYSYNAFGDVRMALYDGDPLTPHLIWQSNSTFNAGSNSFTSIPVGDGTPATLPALPAGSYWLAWQTSTASAAQSYLPGAADSGFACSMLYGAFPAGFAMPAAVPGPHPVVVLNAENWTSTMVYALPNRAPTNIGLSGTRNINENAANGTSVGALSTVDPDAGNTFTYAFAGAENNAGGRFAIAGAQLNVGDGSLINYESRTSWPIRVRSTDQGGLFVEKVFTIAVLNVNEAPTNISLSGTRTVPEGAVGGYNIGTLGVVDPDAGETFAYAFIGPESNAAGRFQTVGAQLQVANGQLIDYETRTSHAIRLRSTDHGGLTTVKVFTITVTNVVDESPTNIGLSGPRTVNENAPTGTAVGELSTIHGGGGSTFTYTFTGTEGNAGGRFMIVGAQLQVDNGALIDYETRTSHQIRVRSTDQGGAFTEKLFTITVLDVSGQ